MALVLNSRSVSHLFGNALTLHSRTIVYTTPSLVKKKDLDFSNVPVLDETDLEEKFVRGSGPGGQAVNKTSNCVVLIHKPTGLIVKCHQTRSVTQNRKIARDILLNKLDNLLNNEHSIEAQTKAIEESKSRKQEQKRRKLLELKQKWKESEGIT